MLDVQNQAVNFSNESVELRRCYNAKTVDKLNTASPTINWDFISKETNVNNDYNNFCCTSELTSILTYL